MKVGREEREEGRCDKYFVYVYLNTSLEKGADIVIRVSWGKGWQHVAA